MANRMTMQNKNIAMRPGEGWRRVKFTVASALLSELGERLVGAPHIALGELVKNAYDADATQTIIRIQDDRIEVIDNGHGMNFTEFEEFWMRVGTTHKYEKRVSPEFKRPMTGSKGVGRLAVQFLASRIEIRTVPKKGHSLELQAYIDWDEAVRAGELVEAEALCSELSLQTEFPDGKSHGTAITLSGLKQGWTGEDIKKLAQQIWWLQPPFRSNPNLKTEAQRAFNVKLESADEKAVEEFDSQMRAAQNNWYARIVGRLRPSVIGSNKKERKVALSVEFRGDERPIRYEYPIPAEKHHVPYCRVDAVEFEVRIYYLWGKQRAEVSVSDAREYFRQFGGIHVYDAGFHLPYYGLNTDWLSIEADHSHRLNESQLLPKPLQEGVSRGLNFLPTQERIFGVVNVDTSAERAAVKSGGFRAIEDYLKISVTRDRLIENGAFDDLKFIVRFALDFYAFQEARRKAQEKERQRPTETLDRTFERFEKVLAEYEDDIPKPAYKAIIDQAHAVRDVSTKEAELFKAQSGLLATLATAGISTIAYEHEVGKQLQFIEAIVEDIRKVYTGDQLLRRKLDSIANDLKDWVGRAHATRALFSPLMDEENREAQGRLRAGTIVDQVKTQIAILTRGIPIDTSEVEQDLRLPEGRFTEWSAIFQNLFINAVNAMLDSDEKKISVSSQARGRFRMILVQDTGVGVDLEDSEELFQPFVRKQVISRERRQLGLGGTGLGLTIVRMIAQNRNCRVGFVKPENGFSTAFSLSWSETK
jgi:signal transduction histidine kinase